MHHEAPRRGLQLVQVELGSSRSRDGVQLRLQGEQIAMAALVQARGRRIKLRAAPRSTWTR